MTVAGALGEHADAARTADMAASLAAGSTPAAVVALLEEASTASQSGQAHVALDAVDTEGGIHGPAADDAQAGLK
ncbi:hypothetical protein Franean1_3865 [Parafrankia sp. EAN1pec]|uniref:hypothetical protein n=1 Tax=Parafrankia sp. (strain EAN1pec) TaxID=298653 RepID=UPI00005429EF|nr:hypothetical protein Franean1_3865 [Frankia sp. EAN1pec]